jgi:hypothetical protein
MKSLMPLFIIAAICYFGYEYMVNDKKPNQVVSETYEYAKNTAMEGRNSILEKNISSKLKKFSEGYVVKGGYKIETYEVDCENNEAYGALCTINLIVEKNKGSIEIEFYGAQVLLTEKINLFDPKKDKMKVELKINLPNDEFRYLTINYLPDYSDKYISFDYKDHELENFSGKFNLVTTDYFDKNFLSNPEELIQLLDNSNDEVLEVLGENISLDHKGIILELALYENQKYLSERDKETLKNFIPVTLEICEKIKFQCSAIHQENNTFHHIEIIPPRTQKLSSIVEQLKQLKQAN